MTPSRMNKLFDLARTVDGIRTAKAKKDEAEAEIRQLLDRGERSYLDARRCQIATSQDRFMRRRPTTFALRELGFARVFCDSGEQTKAVPAGGAGAIIVTAHRPGAHLMTLFLHTMNLAPYNPAHTDGILLVPGEPSVFPFNDGGRALELVWHVRPVVSTVVPVRVSRAHQDKAAARAWPCGLRQCSGRTGPSVPPPQIPGQRRTLSLRSRFGSHEPVVLP